MFRRTHQELINLYEADEPDSIQSAFSSLSAESTEEKEEEHDRKKTVEEFFLDELLKDMDGHELNRLAANYERLFEAIEVEALTHRKANALLPARARERAEKLNQANTDALHQLLNAIYYDVTSQVTLKINKLPPEPKFQPPTELDGIFRISNWMVLLIPVIPFFIVGVGLYELFQNLDSEVKVPALKADMAKIGVFCVGFGAAAAYGCYWILEKLQISNEVKYDRIYNEAKANHQARLNSWLSIKEEFELRQRAQSTRNELNSILHQ